MDSDAVSVHSNLSLGWPFDRTFLSLLAYYLLSAFLGALHLLVASVIGSAILLAAPHSRYNVVTSLIVGSIGGAIAAPLALYVLGPHLGTLFSSRVRKDVFARWVATAAPGLGLALFGSPVGFTVAAWSAFIPIDCDSSARRYWRTQGHCMSGRHSLLASLLGAAILALVFCTIVELSCRFGKEGLWEAVEEGWEGAAGVEWRRRIAERRRLEQGDPRMGERQALLNGSFRPRRYTGQSRDFADEERDTGGFTSPVSGLGPFSPPLPNDDGTLPPLIAAPSFASGHLRLSRPLVSLDLETTGLSTTTARIVEISLVKLYPSASPVAPPRIEKLTSLVDPGDHQVEPAASAVHGHTNASLAGQPSFASLAPQVLDFVRGCDLTGYNILKFDVPLLTAEFARLSPPVTFPSPDSQPPPLLIDTMALFHSLVPKRDLAAAHRVYVGEEFPNAHTAEADAEAALKVLQGMLERHAGRLPASAASGHPPAPVGSRPRDRSWSGSMDMSISMTLSGRSRSSSRATQTVVAPPVEDVSGGQDVVVDAGPSTGLGMPRTLEGILEWLDHRNAATKDPKGKGKSTGRPASATLRPDAPAFATPPRFRRTTTSSSTNAAEQPSRQYAPSSTSTGPRPIPPTSKSTDPDRPPPGIALTPTTKRQALDFGKHRGLAVEDLAKHEDGRRYLRWVANVSEAPPSAKDLCRAAVSSWA